MKPTKVTSRPTLITVSVILIIVFIAPPIYYHISEGYVASEQFVGTFWSLVPALLAIVLALITKQVFCSIFLGVLAGAVYWAGFNMKETVNNVMENGFVAALNSYNIGILIFLVLLGTIVALMNKAGGSRAFADWASKHIKSRIGAQLATIALGILVFVDDYFNCLTVGSVMRPVTDKYKVSRAKLAYLIDSTAAPICIIAPVSSWAAAVSGFVPGSDGFKVFLSTIPYNIYAFLAIAMLVLVVVMKFDFGPMRLHEKNALNGDLFSSSVTYNHDSEDYNSHYREGAIIWDLLLPILTLIVCCVFFMSYTGGIFDGVSFIDSISNCDASISLALGSLVAVIVSILYYVCRKSLSFEECMNCIPAGFKAMVPAILILCFAWTLKTMTDSLGSGDFIKGLLENTGDLVSFLPAVFFLIGAAIAFSTGTSWGTFGILIPIVVASLHGVDDTLMTIAIAACMAGSVCGDHCSPISDTTIMSSAGSQCSLMNHVNTQMPYVLVVAGVSFVNYIIAGFVKSWIVCIPLSVVMLVAVMYLMKRSLSNYGNLVE